MTYTPDPNEIAAREERREAQRSRAQGVAPGNNPIRGTFSVWGSLKAVAEYDPVQSHHVTLDLSKPGLVVAYDEAGNAEIFAPAPGWYMNFVPDREGE